MVDGFGAKADVPKPKPTVDGEPPKLKLGCDAGASPDFFSGVFSVDAAEPKENEKGELLAGADEDESAGLAVFPKLKAGVVDDALEVVEPKLKVGADDELAPKEKAGLVGEALEASDFLPGAVGGELSMLEENRSGLGLFGAANEKAGAVAFRVLESEVDSLDLSPGGWVSLFSLLEEVVAAAGKEKGEEELEDVAFDGSKTKLPAGGVDDTGVVEAVTGFPAKVKVPVGTEGGAARPSFLAG